MTKPTRRRPGLDRWIKDTVTPVFGVNRQRRLVFFNEGCERLTGWQAEQVTGQLCNYTSDQTDASPQALADCLCPPPEVLAGQTARVPIYVVRPAGQALPREVSFHPLRDAAGQISFVIGILQELSTPRAKATVSATQRLHAELAALRQTIRQRYRLAGFVGNCPAIQRVCQQVQSAQQNLLPVHLHGGSGTGKEHVARTIHYGSECKGGTFVPLDCQRLTAFELRQLLRRALEPDPSQPAAMLPSGLYLEHVDHLSGELQKQLSEALDNQTALRIYSATEKEPLEECVEQERFLPRLLYQLTPLLIECPALRERREDTRLLAQHFLEQNNRGQDKQVAGFADAVWDAFAEYNWPGNVLELQLVVEECWQSCDGELVLPEHLPFRFRTGLSAQEVAPREVAQPYDLEQTLNRIEAEHIRAALEACNQNRSAAAELLGLTRARLYRRMESLGID